MAHDLQLWVSRSKPLRSVGSLPASAQFKADGDQPLRSEGLKNPRLPSRRFKAHVQAFAYARDRKLLRSVVLEMLCG